MSGGVTVWAAGGFELAEGPRLVERELVFVDILSGRLLGLDIGAPGTPRVIAALDVPLGAVAPVAGAAGTWIAAAGTGIALLGPDGGLDWLARPEDANAVPARMNDGCCDPAGRFWAGSMAYDNTPGAGSLYRTEPDGTVTRVLDGLTIANGPAFDPERELMYLTDSGTGVIRRFHLDGAGDLDDGHVFATVDPVDGSPDGMTVDSEGRLWTALWGGSRVRCYRPDGAVDGEIDLPAPQPSSVCLADRRLFVTTARLGLPDAGASSGAVLCVNVAASAAEALPWRPASRL